MPRVLFNFDDASYSSLKSLADGNPFNSMVQAVRDSLELISVLIHQAREGYTELIVRDPKSDRQKILVVPFLKRIHQVSGTNAEN